MKITCVEARRACASKSSLWRLLWKPDWPFLSFPTQQILLTNWLIKSWKDNIELLCHWIGTAMETANLLASLKISMWPLYGNISTYVFSGGSRGSDAGGGGVTKSAQCAAGEGAGGGFPWEIFRKMDANGAFWVSFLPIACWFSSIVFAVIFVFKTPIYVMRENVYP